MLRPISAKQPGVAAPAVLVRSLGVPDISWSGPWREMNSRELILRGGACGEQCGVQEMSSEDVLC